MGSLRLLRQGPYPSVVSKTYASARVISVCIDMSRVIREEDRLRRVILL